jgi:futalosine hydrolase
VRLVICVATALEENLLQQRIGGLADVHLVRSGVGPVNAAVAATLAIAAYRPEGIVVECYGDLGAESPGGFIDMKALGFPVVNTASPLYNDLPMQIFPVPRREKFVTVSTCTGTEATARALEAQTGGAVENMEGAAIAHVAHLYRIPAGEVRGISNMVTNRETSTWKIREAAEAAQSAVIGWIEGLAHAR